MLLLHCNLCLWYVPSFNLQWNRRCQKHNSSQLAATSELASNIVQLFWITFYWHRWVICFCVCSRVFGWKLFNYFLIINFNYCNMFALNLSVFFLFLSLPEMLSFRMVHVIAMEVLPEERDRKYYADSYSCCPPPLFILLITIIEVRF